MTEALAKGDVVRLDWRSWEKAYALLQRVDSRRDWITREGLRARQASCGCC